MHSTQPLLNRAESHSKAVDLKLLVWILCALVAVLSVLVGNLYHQQNQYRELLTNEAPVSKEIAVKSMTPMVMNHQTMFEGTHMDLNKLVAEEFTEDSAGYLLGLYKEHYGEDGFEEVAVGSEEDDFEEIAVGGPKTTKFKAWMKSISDKFGAAVKVMQKFIYALVRGALWILGKINTQLNQVTAGVGGLNLQFTFNEGAKDIIATLKAKAEKADTKDDAALDGVKGGKDAKGFLLKYTAQFLKLIVKVMAAYRHFVCNTGLRVKGFQLIISPVGAFGMNMLLDTDPTVIKVYTEKGFDTDLSEFTAPEVPPSCEGVSTALGIKDYAEKDAKKKWEDEQTFFPFECPECEKNADIDGPEAASSDMK